MIKLNSMRYHPQRSGRKEDNEDFDFHKFLTESLLNESDIKLLLTHNLTSLNSGTGTGQDMEKLSEEEIIHVLQYFDKAPEIHPDNYYGKKGESV